MDIERFAAVVDTHTGGEPTRLIVGGGPLLKGSTITEKWLDFKKNHDDFRAFVMCEPHGHADMFGALLVPACHPEAQYGSSSWMPARAFPCAATARSAWGAPWWTWG